MFNIASQTLNNIIMTTIQFNTQLANLREAFQSYAYSLTQNGEDANDLVQETYLKALTYKDKFDPSTNLKAWMFTIMKNTFINNYRRESRVRKIVDTTDNMYYINLGSTSSLGNSQDIIQHNELQAVVDSLEDEFRIPFEMHFGGYKYKEIADHMNLSIGTVKSRIFFARKKLMGKLKHLEN